MQIAIVGSGIAGLACAHILGRSSDHTLTLYEADARLGGHSNTVTVEDPTVGELDVDTGFIVHNRRNYPRLLQLFKELGVETQASEMTFGVFDEASGLSYSATSLSSLFAQRKNVVRPTLWRMLADIVRFYRAGQRLLETDSQNVDYTIGDMLADGKYSKAFLELHLIPMGSAVWSSNPGRFKDFPAQTLLRFLDNHGLLGWGDRPAWRTVVGGSRTYVEAIRDGFEGSLHLDSPVTGVRRNAEAVEVEANGRSASFDRVILACHSDQSLELLANPSAKEHSLLAAVEYQPNEATLHTDLSILPAQQRAWAAWNYRRPVKPSPDQTGSTVTYDMTNLQRLPGSRRYLVSLNSSQHIAPDTVLGSYRYAHPVFDSKAIRAQKELEEMNGTGGIFFAGAWLGYGFHEDGIASAVRVCKRLGVDW